MGAKELAAAPGPVVAWKLATAPPAHPIHSGANPRRHIHDGMLPHSKLPQRAKVMDKRARLFSNPWLPPIYQTPFLETALAVHCNCSFWGNLRGLTRLPRCRISCDSTIHTSPEFPIPSIAQHCGVIAQMTWMLRCGVRTPRSWHLLGGWIRSPGNTNTPRGLAEVATTTWSA